MLKDDINVQKTGTWTYYAITYGNEQFTAVRTHQINSNKISYEINPLHSNIQRDKIISAIDKLN